MSLEDFVYNVKADISGFNSSITDAESRFARFSESSTRSLQRGLLDNLEKGKFSFRALGDVASDVASQLAQSFLGNYFSGDTSSISTALGGFVGSLFGKAAGGTVSPNRATLVGERGPEIFMPRAAGSVLPHSMLGAGISSGGMQVHNTFHISAGVQGTVKQEILQALPLIEERTKSSVLRAIDRGGAMARKVGARA